ncbi:DNA-binding protein RHL1 isoform X2 [Cornus florida]|uniref:DNA-binding protein RHL1 isoform X2 n=1 Tax=Cornus florida TaxID=4283 RepID=UPI0028A253EB|nr:DNA-binding protein RHL1 isoform X2 [Cornus florida]
MVRGGKKEVGNREANPEGEERRRLKKLALSKNILSEAPARACSTLRPSKTVTKHHGRDILRKSQRKNKFLFSFPGLLAPISGGKIGELKDLGTKNPILYLHFPQGQMKLFGTIVYPKNRYLTLQFSRGGKNVMCEDYFDTMIVFSDAWWIGRKEENPEEVRLEFPKELNEGQPVEFDFKGGAGGAAAESIKGVSKSVNRSVVQQSPKAEVENDLSDGQNNVKDSIEVTPTRQSKRSAGKTFKFAEVSSGDDSVETDADTTEGEEDKVDVGHPMRNYSPGKTENSCSLVEIDNEDASMLTHNSGQVQKSAMSVTKSEEHSHTNHTSLVQATISTLFKKVEEKAPRNLKKSPSSKVSGQNTRRADSKRKIGEVKAEGPRKKGKVTEGGKAGTRSTPRKKQLEVEAEDIEEFSSTSKDTDGSDEDWGV